MGPTSQNPNCPKLLHSYIFSPVQISLQAHCQFDLWRKHSRIWTIQRWVQNWLKKNSAELVCKEKWFWANWISEIGSMMKLWAWFGKIYEKCLVGMIFWEISKDNTDTFTQKKKHTHTHRGGGFAFEATSLFHIQTLLIKGFEASKLQWTTHSSPNSLDQGVSRQHLSFISELPRSGVSRLWNLQRMSCGLFGASSFEFKALLNELGNYD